MVKNGTTNKPSPGDEVVLKRVGNGMEDVGTTKTNSKGEFTFNAPATQGRPYLIWVKHQEVTYTRVAQPGGGLISGTGIQLIAKRKRYFHAGAYDGAPDFLWPGRTC